MASYCFLCEMNLIFNMFILLNLQLTHTRSSLSSRDSPVSVSVGLVAERSGFEAPGAAMPSCDDWFTHP